MNISEKADKYAEGKANEAITRAIAQAYMDGYRDGYNDREEEIPEGLRESGVEYVDLGLPSGTLWSSDYLKEDDEIVFLPYGKAKELRIPSEEQIKELQNFCKWDYDIDKYSVRRAKCIGPNGNVLYFEMNGIIESDKEKWGNIHFWLEDETDSIEKKCVLIYNIASKNSDPTEYRANSNKVMTLFSGFKLPIRLVR